MPMRSIGVLVRMLVLNPVVRMVLVHGFGNAGLRYLIVMVILV